jgi:hypothetical protein
MNKLQKYLPFLASASLMTIVLLIIYPHYQYYVDPDGTAYLTISKYYASGDFQKAVNAYWSPWSCWLTAILMCKGLAAIPASVVVNALSGVGFLYISQSFFLKFDVSRPLQWLFSLTLGLFLCYAVFWQSFDDLWECFFLLSILRVMLADGYRNKPILWITCGAIGALAYFAKAYSFPFFILNTLVCTYFISKGNKAQWVKMSLTSIGIMVFCGHFWIVALHHKYGIWTTSTSGPLNLSWYLIGHPHWATGIKQLIPPVYSDGPYYWEDPYFANGDTPHFWNSFSLAGLQVLRLGYNIFKLIRSLSQISVAFPLAVLLALNVVRTKYRQKVFSDDIFILALSMLLFPLGYLLVNFEPRYIWYMVTPGLILSATYFDRIGATNKRTMLTVVFAVSFLVMPIKDMIQMYDCGKDDYETAQKLNALHINGSFTSVTKPGRDTQAIERLAYFAGDALYSIPHPDISDKDLLSEMRRYHVKYYFAYHNSAVISNPHDEKGMPFPEITNGTISGLSVYVVNP